MSSLFGIGLRRCKKKFFAIHAGLEAVEQEILTHPAQFPPVCSDTGHTTPSPKEMPAQTAPVTTGAVQVHCLSDPFDDLLPTGPLGLLVAFAEKLDYFKAFQTHFQIAMKSVDYTPIQKLLTLVYSLAVGCDSIKDINHKLRPYSAAARLLGLERVPDQSQIHRLLHAFQPQHVGQIELIFESLLQQFGLCHHVQRVDLDLDSTGLMVYGNTYQFSRKGYFPRQRGRRGYRLTLAYSSKPAGNEILGLFFDPANTSPGARFWDCIYQAADILGSLDRIGLIRSDAANGTGADIEELLDLGLDFLIKGYSSKTARAFAAHVQPTQWEPVDLFTRVAELGPQRITNCRYPVRVVLVELTTQRQDKHIYSHLYTSLSPQQADPQTLFHNYNGRETIEAMIKASKNGLHIRHLRTRSYTAIHAFLYLAAITFNLIALFRATVLKGTDLEDLGLREITDKLMDIPAKCHFNVNQLQLTFPANHPYTNGLLALNEQTTASASPTPTGFTVPMTCPDPTAAPSSQGTLDSFKTTTHQAAPSTADVSLQSPH